MAEQVNRMAGTLSERFHMLKFLPRHTLEAISRRAQRGETVQCERVCGAVLFSDIRGYTALSAEMTDEAIVGMLNHYLRRQAEIVEQHGGSIDKFMGDAVLALFIGDGGAARAVAAGLHIRDAVEQLNREAVFKGAVHIGIGISFGEMVLGEIGSEDRRERTPIGSVVNLASRLCSRAGSEEILVSDSVRGELGSRLRIAHTQPLALKGFNDPQLTHWAEALAPSDEEAAPSS
jgi:adenylate cyclase